MIVGALAVVAAVATTTTPINWPVFTCSCPFFSLRSPQCVVSLLFIDVPCSGRGAEGLRRPERGLGGSGNGTNSSSSAHCISGSGTICKAIKESTN